MKSCIFWYHNLLIYKHKGKIRQEKGGDWRISATSDCLNKKQYILELLIFYYEITSIPQSLKHNFFNDYPALMIDAILSTRLLGCLLSPLMVYTRPCPCPCPWPPSGSSEDSSGSSKNTLLCSHMTIASMKNASMTNLMKSRNALITKLTITRSITISHDNCVYCSPVCTLLHCYPLYKTIPTQT